MRRRDFIRGTGIAAASLALTRPSMGANAPVAGNEIVLGQSATVTGPLGRQIVTLNSGIQLALDEANRLGGVHKRQVRLVTLDDGLEPRRAVANYKALLTDHKASALFACVGTATVAAGAELLRESGAPMFGGYAVTDFVRERTSGPCYYVRAGFGREIEVIAQQLATIGTRRIALVHLANPGVEELKELFRARLAAQKLEAGVMVGIANDGANADEVAGKLAEFAPQAIILFIGSPLCAALMERLLKTKLRPTYYGASIVAGDQVAKMLKGQAKGLVVTQVVSNPWHTHDTTAREFRRLSEAAGALVSYSAYEGYITTRLMLEALKRAGPEAAGPKLHAAIRALKTSLAGMDFDFSGASNTGSRFAELVQVAADGRFVR
ncbi:MAG: Extracellular ligand-binding receptor [Ramlibacter sp.]|nr:Extracellular ligand-binding receptor [Ramlibacter sp.]